MERKPKARDSESKNKIRNLLPKTTPEKLPGTVHAQFKRCGKPNCRCRTSGELHGAYFYYFVRVDGKQRKRYLKAAEVEAVQAACAARQSAERATREQQSEFQRRIGEINCELRRINQLINSTEL